MNHVRKMIISVLIFLLSLTNVIQVSAVGADSTSPNDTDSGYVRLKSDYLGSYLYEDTSDGGKVKRGYPTVTDATYFEWAVEGDPGAQRIRNRGTGNYITMHNVVEWNDPVTSQALDEQSTEFQWNIQGTGDGTKTIESVNKATAYLHVEALNLDFAECTNGVQPGWKSAHWVLESLDTPVVPPQPPIPPPTVTTDPYYRISNDWKGLYLFEENGQVKYGNPAKDDETSHWQVQDFNGHQRLINRATGHVMNTEHGFDYVESTTVQDDWESTLWDISVNEKGNRLIQSVTHPGSYIHIENLRKYAQMSPIPPSWGSPQWKFTAVSSDPYAGRTVRFKNSWKGTYLVEQDGKVAYGTPSTDDDAASQWVVIAQNGHYQLQNSLTGHYIAVEHYDSNATPVEAIQIESSWTSAQWDFKAAPGTNNDGLFNIENVYRAAYILHVQDQTGFAQASDLPPNWGSGQWTVEIVPTPPTVSPTGYFRIKNKDQGTFLYENAHGVVLYGSPDAGDMTSHWIIEEDQGHQRIKNRATQHYLSIQDGMPYVQSVPAPQVWDRTLWTIADAPQAGYVNLQNVGDPDLYVNSGDSFGYAQYDFVSTESGTASWKLEDAPATGFIPEPQISNERSNTLYEDTGIVQLRNAQSGNTLVEIGGVIQAIAVAAGDDRAGWLVQHVNGHQRLRNYVTGDVLTWDQHGLKLVPSDNSLTDQSEWYISDRAGFKRITSAVDGGTLIVEAAGLLVRADPINSLSANWLMVDLPSDIRYEASNAFKSSTLMTKDGYVGDFAQVGNKLVFTVHVESEGDYTTQLSYRNAAGKQSTSVTRFINGLEDGQVTFAASSNGNVLEQVLHLRAGTNTITFERTAADTGGLNIASLAIQHSVSSSYRGVTEPYVTYEAEDAQTNGTLVGPSRKYREIASEASGRQAVKLDQVGQYVEMTLTKPANALVLRYALPDAWNGVGVEAPISIYINGNKQQELTLTSKYSWVYGSYPWSNDPAQQGAHRFFDESRTQIGELPAGTKLRLQVDQLGAAVYRILDLVETELAPEPYVKPANFLSITEFGAIANDGQDDTAAIQAAIVAAKQAGKGVWIPEGHFDMNELPIEVDQIVIRGAGPWYTVLNGINAGFEGVGNAVEFYDFAIDGDSTGRNDAAKESAFDGTFGTNSVIQNVWIEHRKTGIWINSPSQDLHIVGNRIRDTYADGINIHGSNNNVVVEQNALRNTGDDGIAIWSDRGFSVNPSNHNQIRFNTVQLPWLASNIAVYGGKDNVIEDNIVADTVAFGGGINLSSNHAPVSFSETTMIQRNTLIRTGGHEYNSNQDFGSIWVNAAENITGATLVQHNDIYDASYQGISIQGPVTLSNATFRGNIVEGAGTWGVQLQNSARGSAAMHTIIRNAFVGDQSNLAGANFTLTEPESDEPAAVSGPDPDPDHSGDRRPSVPPQSLPAGTLGSDSYVVAGGNVDGKSLTVVMLDAKKLESALQGLPVSGATTRMLIIDATAAERAGGASNERSKDAIQISLPALSLQNEIDRNPSTIIQVKVDGVSYDLPLSILNLALLSGQVGGKLEDLKVNIRIEQVQGEQRDLLNTRLSQNAMTAVGDFVDFTVFVQSNQGNRQEVNDFGQTYVTRTMEISSLASSDHATVVSVNPTTGEISFVPSVFEKEADGSTLVIIKRNSNSIYAVVTSNKSFTDVAQHWAKSDIELLASKWIVDGMSDEQFQPEGRVTRAQFAALLVRSLGLKKLAQAESNFTDVKATAWYADVVAMAVKARLVDGFDDGTFRPEQSISREEMAVMLDRAIQFTKAAAKSSGELPPTFADQGQISSWAASAVHELAANGIISGMSDTQFAPQGIATRAQAAVMLKRFLVHVNFMNP